MPLKAADDKSKRVKLLEDLQRVPSLSFSQKDWLRNELSNLKKGIAGERDAAYYIDHYFDKGENHVVLHDLRFVIDDEVTQIDHLVIARGGNLYLMETKNFACNLIINERGEFTAEYERGRFGIPSPIEQSLRHERGLRKLLERLDIGTRVQKFDFYHVVMLHPKAIIERPPVKSFDTFNVIKADQFPSWHQKFVDKVGIGKLFMTGLNMRSLDTIKEWGEKLARQHRPADLLALPDFMQPKAPVKFSPPAAAPISSPGARPAAARPAAPAAPPAAATTGPATAAVARPATSVPAPAFAPVIASRPVQAPAPAPRPVQQAAEEAPAKRLICAHCGTKISFAEGKFCWGYAKRFGGLAYCREHQALR